VDISAATGWGISHETWRFAVPDSNASVEEWQIWLDELLSNETDK